MKSLLTLNRCLLASTDEPDAVAYTMARRSRDEIRRLLLAGSDPLIACECSCECGEHATTTEESAACCESCSIYAVDDDGEVVCSRDPRYVDDGEWTGGGMHGIGSCGWVSRPRVRTDSEVRS